MRGHTRFMQNRSTVTRFAPSPTGHLHLGHAHSALFGWNAAREAGGRFLVRIEDIDPVRCRPEFERDLLEDLAWLGLTWDEPVRRQSEHLDEYKAALDRLSAFGVLYPCFCTRKDIAAEIAGAGHAPHGPDGPLYPGSCRTLDSQIRAERLAMGMPYALRLDVAAAMRLTGPLRWYDRGRGWQDARPDIMGDVVLARKDIPASYHIAVTVDDHIQRVSVVTRGEDLFFASNLHRLLQALLGFDEVEWMHHRLLTNERGERLAKRDAATTLRALRASGHRPDTVRFMAGFPDRRP